MARILGRLAPVEVLTSRLRSRDLLKVSMDRV